MKDIIISTALECAECVDEFNLYEFSEYCLSVLDDKLSMSTGQYIHAMEFYEFLASRGMGRSAIREAGISVLTELYDAFKSV
jgi:hypothetical protein